MRKFSKAKQNFANQEMHRKLAEANEKFQPVQTSFKITGREPSNAIQENSADFGANTFINGEVKYNIDQNISFKVKAEIGVEDVCGNPGNGFKCYHDIIPNSFGVGLSFGFKF